MEADDELVCIRKCANAKMPVYNKSGDTVINFFCAQTTTIMAGTTTEIPTGIAIKLPRQVHGRICGCRHLALQNLHVYGEIIDWDNRDEIIVIVTNNSSNDIVLSGGDMIVHLICERNLMNVRLCSNPY